MHDLPLIINIAGTNGAGKSTVARALLKQAKQIVPRLDPKRNRPLGYDLVVPGVKGNVYLMGTYEAPTGGCDTLNKVGEMFEFIQQEAKAGNHVVYEGMTVMNMTRGPKLVRSKIGRVHVLHLTTPEGTCRKSVDDRRAEKGDEPLYDYTSVKTNNVRANNYVRAMRSAGARVYAVTRREAFGKLMGILQG